MLINLRPDNYLAWAPAAIEKIERTINSCETARQLKIAKKMVDNFIVVSIMEEDSNDEDIQWISHQLWLRVKIQEINLKQWTPEKVQ